jgi:hypothetical protein
MEFQRCAPYLTASLEHAHGTHTLDDVEAGVQNGSLQLWTGPQSAIVTEVLEYPRVKVLHIFLAGGNLAEIEAMYEPIAAWARTLGCTQVRCTGRPGWERTFLKHRGWRKAQVVLQGDL